MLMKPDNIAVRFLKHGKKSRICMLISILYGVRRNLHIRQPDTLEPFGIVKHGTVSILTNLLQNFFNSRLNRSIKRNTPAQLLFKG